MAVGAAGAQSAGRAGGRAAGSRRVCTSTPAARPLRARCAPRTAPHQTNNNNKKQKTEKKKKKERRAKQNGWGRRTVTPRAAAERSARAHVAIAAACCLRALLLRGGVDECRLSVLTPRKARRTCYQGGLLIQDGLRKLAPGITWFQHNASVPWISGRGLR